MSNFAREFIKEIFMKKREALIALVSIAISGILNEPIIAAFKMIPWDKIISTESWEWVFLPKVSILNIIFFIILLVAVYYIAYLLLINRKNVAINKLKSLNYFIDDKNHVKVTWDVGIGTIYNNDPFAYNIQFFCLRHGELPLRMQNGCCQDSTCPNCSLHINERNVENYIESLLLKKQQDLKGLS
jgi:hypothetical protein